MLDLLIQSVIILAIVWILGLLLVGRFFDTAGKKPAKDSPMSVRLIFQTKVFASGTIGFAVIFLLLLLFSTALESLR